LNPLPAPLALALDGGALGHLMRSARWLYPMVEIVHIVGFVLLVGSALMFDLRLLGLTRQLPLTLMARHLLRWSMASLLLVEPAGLLMFSAHPQDFIGSRVFLLKMTLIMTAGLNAAIFHTGVWQGVAGWDTALAAPPSARLHAVLSMMLWLGVIACGRLLAYT
jgi:hypothetical protein